MGSRILTNPNSQAKNDNWDFIITTVYSPNDRNTRERFWHEIRMIESKWSLPWVIEGDFTVERFREERKWGIGHQGDKEKFNRLISHLHLIDLRVVERKYSWSNKTENQSLAKLNRIMINLEWESLFPLASMRVCPKMTSNNIPLKLIERRIFRFEKMWMIAKHLEKVIERNWRPNRDSSCSSKHIQKI